MKHIGFGLLLLLPGLSAAGTIGDWQSLLKQDKVAEAKEMCLSASKDSDKRVAAEGYKCLANVALAGNDLVIVDAGETGGGSLHPGYKSTSADIAIGYLDKALELTPDDLSIHKGRLYIMLTSGRYDQAVDALKDSLARYHGSDAYNDWLSYTEYYYSAQRYTPGIEYLKTLDQKYPNDQQVTANIGAFYAMLKQDDEALKYMKRSVELAPNDAMDNWNLGREYDFLGDYKNADVYYQKGLLLDEKHTGDALSTQDKCLYQEFVYKKLQDKTRACGIKATNCENPQPDCSN